MKIVLWQDYINRFSQIVNGSVIYIVPNGDILDQTNSVLNANNLRGQLNFDNTYGKHNITALIEVKTVGSYTIKSRTLLWLQP